MLPAERPQPRSRDGRFADKPRATTDAHTTQELRRASTFDAPHQLTGTDHEHDDLQGAHLAGRDLRGHLFHHAQLAGADLSNCDLRGADFSKADCRATNFQGAQLNGANFAGADLTGAIFHDAVLDETTNLDRAVLDNLEACNGHFERLEAPGVSFTAAQLRNSNLRAANLSNADLAGVDFSGSDMSGANLRGADLTGALLDGIIWNPTTLWPDGFTPPAPPTSERRSPGRPNDSRPRDPARWRT